MQVPIATRVARIAGPAVAAGALITTGAVAAWPGSGSLEAVSASPASGAALGESSGTSPAAPAASEAARRAGQAERGTRDDARPALTESDEKAAAATAAKADAAKEKAAAKDKAAKERAAAKEAAEKKARQLDLTVVGARYTTAAIKLRTQPSKDAKSVDVVDQAEKIKITETIRKGYRLVVVGGKGRWVTNEYLSKKKPSAEAGISDASCSTSSGIESGLVANGVKVYRAICAAFPQVSSYGGRRASNDFHGSGQAVDAMISDSAAGWRLANWLRDNASPLGVREVIYSQKIWTVQRSGEGWRGMSDRGSATANHYDHVHVSVY